MMTLTGALPDEDRALLAAVREVVVARADVVVRARLRWKSKRPCQKHAHNTYWC